MPALNQIPEMPSPKRIAKRHRAKVAAAQRGLSARRSWLMSRAAELEEALDEIVPSYLRYQIRRWLELIALLLLTIAETIVAVTVVQALGLSAIDTDLVALVVGIAATGLAWLIGHEWAVAQDPQAIAEGRNSWLGVAVFAAAAFLIANMAVRVYYGYLAEQVNQLGSSWLAAVLAGVLLTAVTAALMLAAAFVTAHAETGKEAELRSQLRRILRELRVVDNHIGAVDPNSYQDGHPSVIEE